MPGGVPAPPSPTCCCSWRPVASCRCRSSSAVASARLCCSPASVPASAAFSSSCSASACTGTRSDGAGGHRGHGGHWGHGLGGGTDTHLLLLALGTQQPLVALRPRRRQLGRQLLLLPHQAAPLCIQLPLRPKSSTGPPKSAPSQNRHQPEIWQTPTPPPKTASPRKYCSKFCIALQNLHCSPNSVSLYPKSVSPPPKSAWPPPPTNQHLPGAHRCSPSRPEAARARPRVPPGSRAGSPPPAPPPPAAAARRPAPLPGPKLGGWVVGTRAPNPQN